MTYESERSSGRRGTQLQHALSNRAVIEQAKDMLAAKLGVTTNVVFHHSSSTPFMESNRRGRRLTLTGKAGIASVDQVHEVSSGLPPDSNLVVDRANLGFLDPPPGVP